MGAYFFSKIVYLVVPLRPPFVTLKLLLRPGQSNFLSYIADLVPFPHPLGDGVGRPAPDLLVRRR